MNSGGLPASYSARKRKNGACFLLFIMTMIIMLYACYVVILLQPLFEIYYIGASVSAAFHLVFALFLISFYQCSNTEPGRVPAKWGFRVGDESKRRRYCKVCQVWKPDRTHHCSECGKCVLNMDHHCPWINNCVGFYNRRFFIQLLIYAQLSLLFLFVQGTMFLIEQYITLWPYNHGTDPTPLGRSIEAMKLTSVIVMLVIVTPLLLALFPFSRLHIGFIVRNLTTIESLSPQSPEYGRYDLGPERNIQQAFGYNPMQWFCPFNTKSSRPVGDGVRWPVRCPEMDDLEMGQIPIYNHPNVTDRNSYHGHQNLSPYNNSGVYHQL
ncbi:DHHC family palmitoyl transferase [Cryptosporidium ubiquitum]|uniref:Palmitoyltransferase n=1 Tax=Cryptosporidium ubiquitum TaxID=857276 RepID=A0A1J4MK27_9CRYT|nr:DHHC family palmitoyl transferase [Cryptosporidium ubiquitum]OII73372.1 DHHC family palmitoyl transferase [Cryptosporidium ubiquitum]